jgi:hypothetical protein
MTEESAMTEEMDVTQAAGIMRDARDLARRELWINRRLGFAARGLAWIVGYGLVWLVVHGQRPFHGPNPVAFAVVVVLSTMALMSGVEQARAESGVGGLSAVRRRIHFLFVLAGFAGAFLLEGALAHAGASRAVIGVFEAAAPILVIGLFYIAHAAATTDWPVLGLGVWLIVVAAGSGFAGPATAWAIDALAVGIAFLLVAAVQPSKHQA